VIVYFAIKIFAGFITGLVIAFAASNGIELILKSFSIQVQAPKKYLDSDFASYSRRMFDNVLLVAAADLFSALAKSERHPTTPNDSILECIACAAFVCLVWHFILRTKTSNYDYKNNIKNLTASFRFWKLSLIQSFISFLACLACVAVIFYG